jgi:hypothetical protein
MEKNSSSMKARVIAQQEPKGTQKIENKVDKK